MLDDNEIMKRDKAIRDGIGYSLCFYLIALAVFGVIGIIYRISLYIL